MARLEPFLIHHLKRFQPYSKNRLTGINAAQLAVALVSNLFLLLSMAGRVKVTVAQCIVILGWYVHIEVRKVCVLIAD